MKQNTGDKVILKWLLSATKGTKRYIALLTLLQMLVAAASTSQALLIRGIVNSAVAKDWAGFKLYAILQVAIVVVLFLLRTAICFLDEYARSTVENMLKQRLFRNLLYKDYASVTACHSGEWLSRMTADSVYVSGGIMHIVPGIASTAVRLVYAVVLLFCFVPELCLWILVGGLVTICFTWVLRKLMKKLHLQVQQADSRFRVFMTERLGSMMIIRAFRQEKNAMDQGQVFMDDHRRARMKRNRVSGLFNTGFSAVAGVAYTICAIYCGWGIFSGMGAISYGDFTAVLQLVGQVQAPIANISGIFPQYTNMIASAERLMEAENYSEDLAEPAVEDISRFYREKFQSIGLRDAAFTYLSVGKLEHGEADRQSVLRDLNLEVRKGEYVAFCGPSGCGKSTVLKLLMCMYNLDDGQRYLTTDDGEQELNACWRDLFSYVPQGNQLMSGTIREVVTFGDRELMQQDERIHQALKVACADQFMAELPDGLDTLLGERGAGLSEGQMQRIAIARAVFSERPIMLLDEATSALDEATEAKLLDNLRVMTDKTVIIVTHRPAALDITDKIITFTSNTEVQ